MPQYMYAINGISSVKEISRCILAAYDLKYTKMCKIHVLNLIRMEYEFLR